MVEKLTPLADGVTLVPMKKEFSTVALDVISKVSTDHRCHVSGVLGPQIPSPLHIHMV